MEDNNKCKYNYDKQSDILSPDNTEKLFYNYQSMLANEDDQGCSTFLYENNIFQQPNYDYFQYDDGEQIIYGFEKNPLLIGLNDEKQQYSQEEQCNLSQQKQLLPQQQQNQQQQQQQPQPEQQQQYYQYQQQCDQFQQEQQYQQHLYTNQQQQQEEDFNAFFNGQYGQQVFSQIHFQQNIIQDDAQVQAQNQCTHQQNNNYLPEDQYLQNLNPNFCYFDNVISSKQEQIKREKNQTHFSGKQDHDQINQNTNQTKPCQTPEPDLLNQSQEKPRKRKQNSQILFDSNLNKIKNFYKTLMKQLITNLKRTFKQEEKQEIAQLLNTIFPANCNQKHFLFLFPHLQEFKGRQNSQIISSKEKELNLTQQQETHLNEVRQKAIHLYSKKFYHFTRIYKSHAASKNIEEFYYSCLFYSARQEQQQYAPKGINYQKPEDKFTPVQSNLRQRLYQNQQNKQQQQNQSNKTNKQQFTLQNNNVLKTTFFEQ